MAINSVQVCDNIGSMWGVSVKDYKLDGVQTDLQDLLVAVSKQRANAVEQEVTPLSKRMEARNDLLEKFGNALAELTKIQASFKSDDPGSKDMTGWMSSSTASLLKTLGYSPTTISNISEGDYKDNEKRPDFYYSSADGGYSANKKTIEGMIQSVKSKIDGLNTDAQSDMTRLQSLVDRRDEAYSTATNLMTDVSDTRSNAIRNM
ncbi:MAG: hypothetical protein ACI4YA_01100 [Candidatus Spyradenecus sp.]